ncbi:MAG: hypothetical protein MSQ05_10515 [Akkermansia sp.]|nr:hypothetical protein [Akkermansia sp.]
MRLHLPKTLLAAVLAACAALPAGATITETPLETLTVGDIPLPTAPEGQSTIYKQAATDASTENEIPSALESATDTFLSGTNATRVFKVLNSSTVENAGTLVIAKATVDGTESNAGQLHLSRWSESTKYIGTELTIANDLIIGETAAGKAIRLSDADNDARLITLTGTITLAQDAQIGVDSTVTSGHGKITGSISGDGKTLTIAKGGNGSGVLNMGDSTTGKTLTLGGLTIANATGVVMNYETANIGTLTLSSTATNAFTLSGGTTTVSTVSGSGSILLNGGTLVLNAGEDITLSNVKFAGGILDLTSATGSVTVGGTWTGDFVEKSVEVINANNATIAGSLATSLNPSRLLNYMFKAGDADAGESASSVYRVRREYITATAIVDSTQQNRIVIGSVTGVDGSTEFNNVGLNELIAGDKVTINGLTGWIGQDGSNTILADLEFTGENHINYGSSSNNWITYSGAITGNGTLSYDWGTAAYTYNFNGDLSGFTGTISDNATLNVTIGGTLAKDAAKAVNATINIAGALTVNREASFAKAITVGGKLIVNADSSIAGGTVTGNMDLKSGALTINGNVALKGGLDMKGGDTADDACRGHLSVAKGGTLNVSGNIWVLENSAKILLADGGKLEWNDLTVTGKTAVENVETGLKFGKSEKLQLSTGEHTVTNSTIKYAGSDSKTLGWTLTGTDLVVQSGRLSLGTDVSAAKVTVKSGGTLELLTGYTQNVTANTWAWEEGSTLSYGRFGTGNDLVDLGVSVGTVSGTTIELHGVLGTLKAVSSSIKRDIKLTNSSAAAGEFTTIEGDSYTFDGKVKGGGNFALAQASKTTSLIFNGDLSEWTSESAGYSGLRVISGTVNATISGTPTNEEVKNAFNKDAGGTLNLTIDRDAILTNTVNITSLAVNAKKTLSLSDDNNAVAVGSTTVGDKAKLVIGNKAESTRIDLGTVSGSGTISSERKATQSVTLGTGADNAFTGTLEATKGQLNVTAKTVQLLAGLKANGGNIDVMNATSLSVTDMVIGDNATVGVYSEADTESSLNIYGSVNSKASLTIGSDATLKANLSVCYAKLTFNGGPLTMGSTLTLFDEGSSELLGIDLTTVTATGLTLFTGVDGFSIGHGLVSADAVTIDDAHDIFGNLTAGAYSLKYTGGKDGDVLLIANNPTPEPTTATLSLLALMGLAARRRRKA